MFAAYKKMVLVLWIADAGDKSQHLICCVPSTTELRLQPPKLLLLLLFFKRMYFFKEYIYEKDSENVAEWVEKQ